MLVRVALFAMAVLPFQGHRLTEFTPCFFSGSVPCDEMTLPLADLQRCPEIAMMPACGRHRWSHPGLRPIISFDPQ